MSNRYTLAQLPEVNAAEIPLDHIEMLLEDVAEMKSNAAKYATILTEELARRYSIRAACERASKGKDTGTVRVKDGDHVVIADLPKAVDWDQEKLTDVVKHLSACGEDVTEYVGIKYSVSEAAFNNWPKSLKSLFEPARTVKCGKATYKLEKV